MELKEKVKVAVREAALDQIADVIVEQANNFSRAYLLAVVREVKFAHEEQYISMSLTELTGVMVQNIQSLQERLKKCNKEYMKLREERESAKQLSIPGVV